MKTLYTLECKQEYEFIVLAINSHSKPYTLCWSLNQTPYLNFEKSNYHKIDNKMFFSRYKSEDEEGNVFNLVSNWSTKGYMIPHKRSINYFLIISLDFWKTKKEVFLDRLREIKNILLVFEIDLNKEKYSDRFVIYDKKN